MPTTLSDLFDLVYRRRASLLLLFAVTLFATLSRHVFGLALPPIFTPTLLVGGVALVVWISLVWLRSEQAAHHSRRERKAVIEHHGAFAATVSAFVTAVNSDDEPEAEALREGLSRRNDALLAARRALGRGEAPETDKQVLELTQPGERADATGHSLVQRLAMLQREALVAAQRLSMLGEARLAKLDERLAALAPPHHHRQARARVLGEVEPSANPALALLVTGYAVMLPLVATQRITSALVAGVSGTILILFESGASARRRGDP